MIIAGFIGNHAGDTLMVRLGWALTRLVQRTSFKQVTHTEMIFDHHGAGIVDMGSSSIRDGGVRIKEQVKLDLRNWVFVEVPCWDAAKSRDHIAHRVGMPYDWRGAFATVLPGSGRDDQAFCSEICAESVGIDSPETFGPAQLMSVAISMPGARVVCLE